MSETEHRIQWTFTETYRIFNALAQKIGLEPIKPFRVVKLLAELQKTVMEADRQKPSVGFNIGSDFLNFQSELRREAVKAGKPIKPVVDPKTLQVYVEMLQEVAGGLDSFINSGEQDDLLEENEAAPAEQPTEQPPKAVEVEADTDRVVHTKPAPAAPGVKPTAYASRGPHRNLVGPASPPEEPAVAPKTLIADEKRVRVAIVGSRFDWRDPIQREFGSVLKLLFFDDSTKKPDHTVAFDHVFIFTNHSSAEIIRHFQFWGSKAKVHMLAAGVPSLKIDLAELKQESLVAHRK